MKQRIAIIGAGLAGLTLAHRLGEAHDVTVFEKSRGVGGRMSTRSAPPYQFDHGAQFFTIRHPHFREFLRPYLDTGVVQAWEGRVVTLKANRKPATRPWFEPHYVACPGMSSLCGAIAKNIRIELNAAARPLQGTPGQSWTLYAEDERSLGQFDLVISTAPPAQTRQLFGAVPGVSDPFAETIMVPCFALMLGIPQKWEHDWIGAKAIDSPIDWISIDATKPERNHDQTTIVAHTSAEWATGHIDTDLDAVKVLLCEQLETLTRIRLDTTSSMMVHRWLYARRHPLSPTTDNHFYLDRTIGLAATGDWATPARIENVWLAAQSLADHLLAL